LRPMDFDFGQIAVPFRMQPGLRRLAPGEPQLTALASGSALFQEKRRVLEAGASRLCVPGFDPQPAIDAILARAAGQGMAPASGTPLELAFEEDFAVLDADGGTLPWLCVCVPSHWSPEDKLGLPLAAVHAPVADAQMLAAASRHLVQLATGGGRWERFVWTVTPSGRYDQHPLRHARAAWPDTADPGEFASGCWFRAERQTFFPVGGGLQQAVFTIRVMLQPLPQAVDSPEKAQRVHDALGTMSDAVLDYKGLAAARAPLQAWLAGRIAAWN
jgi:hypothetical protein